MEARSSTAGTVARAAAIIAVVTVLSKILGFVREMTLAYGFGAGRETDAYLVALTIPSIIFTLLASALSSGAVPLFASFNSRWGRDETWRIFSAMITFLLVLLTAVTVIGEPFARQLVWLISPKLPEETALLAADLTRIMLPAVIFLALGNLYYGLLNANNIFGPPAFGSVLTNIFIIIGILVGTRYGVAAAAWGVLLGYAAAFILQVPYLRQVGFRYRPFWNLRHPAMGEAWQLILPVLIGTGLSQIYLIIDRILASGLVEGSITALNYAQKVALLPQGILAVPLSTAIFPMLAERAVESRDEDFSRALLRGLVLTLSITFPMAVLLIVLARPTVEVLFMRGAFDEQAARMTTIALIMFAIGMVAQCVNPIMTRGFYARQDSVTPLKCAVVAILMNLILSLILIHPLKHAGLALANSLAATFNIFQLAWRLQKTTGGQVAFGSISGDAVKTLVASAACGLAAWACNWVLTPFLAAGTLPVLVRLAAAGSAGILVYAGAAWILGVSELHVLVDKVKEYIERKLKM